MMKRILALSLALLMLLSCASADELKDQARSLVEHIGLLAGNDTYRRCVTASQVSDLVAAFGDEDHTALRLMVNADISGFTESFMGQVKAFDPSLDPAVEQELRTKMTTSAVMQLISARGAEVLAAVNCVSASRVFASREVGSGLFILLYEFATPAAVSWHAQNGAVSMTATFLPDDELSACRTAQEVEAWITQQGIAAVCTELPLAE